MADAPTGMGRLTKAYVKIREARSALAKQFEAEDGALKAQLEQISALMLDHLNTSGSESVRTPDGTFYKQEQLKPSIADDQAFYSWAEANHLTAEALERRVKTGFVKDYMEENGNTLPPGLSVHREYVVRVRKS